MSANDHTRNVRKLLRIVALCLAAAALLMASVAASEAEETPDNRWSVLTLIYRNADTGSYQGSFSDEKLDSLREVLRELPDTFRRLSGGRMLIRAMDVVVIDDAISSISGDYADLTYGPEGDINFDSYLDGHDYDQVVVFAPIPGDGSWLGLGGTYFTYQERRIYYCILNDALSYGSPGAEIYGELYDTRLNTLTHEMLHCVETNSRIRGWDGFQTLHSAEENGYASADIGWMDWQSDLMRDAIPNGNSGFRPESFLVAHYQDGYDRTARRTFDVTLDAAGGSVSSAAKTVLDGEPVGVLPIPVREGYHFTGWHTDGGTEVDAASVLREAVTLRAGWSETPRVVASGAFGAEGNNLLWTLDYDGELTVSGTGKMEDFKQFGAPWNDWLNNIRKVTVQGGVENVGRYAFDKCAAAEVELEFGVRSVDYCSFTSCANLSRVKLPRSLVNVGLFSFGLCPFLSEVIYGGNETQWADVSIGDYNETLTNARLTCMDADPMWYPFQILPSSTFRNGSGAAGGDMNFLVRIDSAIDREVLFAGFFYDKNGKFLGMYAEKQSITGASNTRQRTVRVVVDGDVTNAALVKMALFDSDYRLLCAPKTQTIPES